MGGPSRIPAFLLVVIAGLAVFLPEAVHSLAHRHGAAHASLDGERHSEAGYVAGHAHGDHLHADLRATPPPKRLLNPAVIAQAAIDLLGDLGYAPPLPPDLADSVAPPQSDHGPPPPTRAPPRV